MLRWDGVSEDPTGIFLLSGLEVNCYQLLVISCQLSVISYQLSVVSLAHCVANEGDAGNFHWRSLYPGIILRCNSF